MQPLHTLVMLILDVSDVVTKHLGVSIIRYLCDVYELFGPAAAGSRPDTKLSYPYSVADQDIAVQDELGIPETQYLVTIRRH